MKKSCVSNLVNMADGVTPLILNPDSASQYDGLDRHVAGTFYRTRDHTVAFGLLA